LKKKLKKLKIIFHVATQFLHAMYYY